MKNQLVARRLKNSAFTKEIEQSRDLREYISTIQQHPLLDRASEHDLAVKARAGDTQARTILIERNLRLVVSIAAGYAGRGIPALDLIQEGNIGLINAVDSFDPDRGLRLSTHASYRIDGAISTLLAEKGSVISVPRYIFRARSNVVHAENAFLEEHGRKPTEDEVMGIVPITREHLSFVRQSQRSLRSLDFTPSRRDDDTTTIADTVADPSSDVEDSVIASLTADELHNHMTQVLTPREQIVLAYMYGLGELHGKTHSQEQFASLLGVARKTVNLAHTSALRKLRAMYQADAA